MKTMILALVFLICAGFSAPAQPLSYEAVVRGLVAAAHKNDLQAFISTADLAKIGAHKRHGLSPEELLELLKTIPEDKITFQAHPDPNIVRMVTPVTLEFTLEERPPLKGQRESVRRVVVLITP